MAGMLGGRLSTGVLAAALLGCAVGATAQESAPTVSDWPVVPHVLQTPRFRFGLSLISGATDLGGQSTIATLMGLETRLGVQLNEWFAVDYETSMTMVWPDWRNAVLFEASLTRYVSAGAGLGAEWVLGVTNGAGSLDNWIALAVPLRLAFNIPFDSDSTSHRYAISLEFEVVPEDIVSSHVVSYGLPKQGVVLSALAGLGFELY